MNRPPIPAELRRAVLVEAGHRCAIPRCGSTEIDMHHIVPWETEKRHEYDNLIALCPNCHRRAHKGEIDRKSLRVYKEKLIADFADMDSIEFSAPIVEIKRRLSEKRDAIPDFAPGYDFAFDFPDFQEPAARIVSRNIEAWGNELLIEYRERQKDKDWRVTYPEYPYWLRGMYEVIRNDSDVISVRYSLAQYAPGTPHRNTQTRVQNYLVRPFRPLTLDELLRTPDSIDALAKLCSQSLLAQRDVPLDPGWVSVGTKAIPENFELFEIGQHAIRFIFHEYQVGPYAVGQQHATLPFYDLREVVDQGVLHAISREPAYKRD